MADDDGLTPEGDPVTARAARSQPEGRKAGGRVEKILKVVGATTAVLSLGAAVYGLGHFVHGILQDRRDVAELTMVAREQQDREQYRDAWATLAEASEIEKTSRFMIDTEALQQAKEDLGMAWLQNIRIGEGETFTAIVVMIEPVLDRGQSSAEPQRKADLLAHLGWAAFLRYREHVTNPDVVERAYRKAIAADPGNPYANAMLGHWIMWNVKDTDAARPYFVAAMASGRAAAFVRRLQLAALGAEAELEQVRVANEMRKTGQPMPSVHRSDVWNVYSSFFRADTGEYAMERILRVIPPEEHLLTFRWLFDQAGFDGVTESMRVCYLGLLQEAAGHRQEALATFQDLGQMGENWHRGSRHCQVQSALRRLSTEPE